MIIGENNNLYIALLIGDYKEPRWAVYIVDKTWRLGILLEVELGILLKVGLDCGVLIEHIYD